eukprot:TRINITY_DN3902_c0_g1_i2.p1 TRINITY_DN3902_c0_g1~~TRINITY_DN3902_c0_g1_i2.p1  ORF type:complete len:400 (+),score=143.96 TRINITY_DN3902_c0_g1_i2:133-1332(+)
MIKSPVPSALGTFPTVTKKLPAGTANQWPTEPHKPAIHADPVSARPLSPQSSSTGSLAQSGNGGGSPVRPPPASISQLLAKSKESSVKATPLAAIKAPDASSSDSNGRLSRTSSGTVVSESPAPAVHFFDEGPADEPQLFAGNSGVLFSPAPPQPDQPKRLLRTTSSLRIITLDENDVPHDSHHPSLRTLPSTTKLMSFIEEFNPADAIREIVDRLAKAETELVVVKSSASQAPGLQQALDKAKAERDKLLRENDSLKDDKRDLERDLELERLESAEKDKRFTDLELAFLLQKDDVKRLSDNEEKFKQSSDKDRQQQIADFEALIKELRRQLEAKTAEVQQMLVALAGKDREILDQQRTLVHKNEEVLEQQTKINDLVRLIPFRSVRPFLFFSKQDLGT